MERHAAKNHKPEKGDKIRCFFPFFPQPSEFKLSAPCRPDIPANRTWFQVIPSPLEAFYFINVGGRKFAFRLPVHALEKS